MVDLPAHIGLIRNMHTLQLSISWASNFVERLASGA